VRTAISLVSSWAVVLVVGALFFYTLRDRRRARRALDAENLAYMQEHGLRYRTRHEQREALKQRRNR
jgi:hypothetical protein